jgi:uncharacterized protein YrrD
MELKQDARVLTATSKDAGRVDRVVIDPKTKEVTHIVVRRGMFLTEDKVVPVSLIASATESGVTLREDAGDLSSLPKYQETHYVSAFEEDNPARRATPVYTYMPHGATVTLEPGGVGYQEIITQKRINIPEDTVALREGARVISSNDKHVGHVDEVLTDPVTNQVSHFVISSGVLLKSRKLIPIEWAADLSEDRVDLAVGTGTLERLQDYSG